MKFILKKILSLIKKLFYPLLGKYFESFVWKYKHILQPMKMNQFGGNDVERRLVVIDKLKSKLPFKKLLDIGCGNGLTTMILSKEMPYSSFIGIDINKRIIQLNNEKLIKEGTKNLKFFQCEISNLSIFNDKEFDYILMEGLLLYVHPNDLKIILKEIIRISKKGLILRQQSCKNTINDGRWIHDFPKVFESIGIQNYTATKVKDQVGDWNKYGYVFDIDLN